MTDPKAIFTESGYDLEDFEDAYQGSYEDGLRGYVYDRAESGLLDIPREFLEQHWNWIDWEEIAHDLDCEGYWTEPDDPGDAYRTARYHVFMPV